MDQLVSYSNRYFKSATLNTAMSQKTERILALFFIPLSIIALTYVLCSLILVLNSSILYVKLTKLKKEYQPKFEALKRNDDLWKLVHPNEIRSGSEFMLDLSPYREAGIDNINPFDPSAPQQAIDQETDNIFSKILIILNCIICFCIPWILIRMYYWIQTADKTLLN